MTLKRQLFIASLLMLLIPWAGVQFVLELDQALRQQASEQLAHQSARLAKRLETSMDTSPVVPAASPVIYATAINRPLTLDGFGSDWPGYDDEQNQQRWQGTAALAEDSQGSINWKVAAEDNSLYLLLRIRRQSHRFFDPAHPERPFDQLRLFMEQEKGVVERVIPSLSRGNVNGLIPGLDGQPDYRIRGFWESTGDNSHQLELRLPRPKHGALFGFRLIGPTGDTPKLQMLFERINTTLVSRQPALEQELKTLIAPGQHVRVASPGGWLLARTSQPSARPDTDFSSLSPMEILERIVLNGLRALVRAYQPTPTPLDNEAAQVAIADLPHKSLVQHPDGGIYLLTHHALNGGRVLILEESLEQMLTLSGSTLGAVIARSLLLLIGLMLVLLGYASWLSWRITRLQRAVNASIDEDGRLLQTLTPSSARDELGELSRQFSQLTERLHGYTHYLESFSRRLSHELKTPVAVVRSSLENLGHSTSDEERDNYIARARSATDRLSQILHGMSEAARLEQSLDHAEKEHFDLADVCAQATQAYQSLAPEFQIRYSGPEQGCQCYGSPELLVQLLDKLVDNARDFTPQNGVIEVRLSNGAKGLNLSVFNEGSALPDDLAQDIFSPFVSVRNSQQEGHLGQGLLIARLIAEHHGARIQARNEADGVRFTVKLPTTD